jgi:hypothetical protein
MIWSKLRFQHSIELYPRVLKEVAPLLFPLSLLLWSIEFYVAWLNKARFADPYNSSMLTLVIVALSGMVLQSIASVIWILYVARSTQRQMKNGTGEHPFSFLKSNFHQTIIEHIRSFISTGIYTLFLILPGIYRWTQLIFVNLVSAFDPEYKKGNKDALKESARLVKGKVQAISLLLALQLTPPLILEEMAKSGHYSFVTIMVLYILSWLFTLYFAIYFSLTFFARWSFKLENK